MCLPIYYNNAFGLRTKDCELQFTPVSTQIFSEKVTVLNKFRACFALPAITLSIGPEIIQDKVDVYAVKLDLQASSQTDRSFSVYLILFAVALFFIFLLWQLKNGNDYFSHSI